jgi:phospholipid/cholesterol/gamma-HCH transport system ATP-binding protein
VNDEPTSGLEPAAARRFDALLLELRTQGVGALVISHDLPSILHVPDEVHVLHEGRIHVARPPSAFVESADPVVRHFIDGRADGPLPVW